MFLFLHLLSPFIGRENQNMVSSEPTEIIFLVTRNADVSCDSTAASAALCAVSSTVVAFGSDTVCAVLNTVVAFGSDTVCAALNTVVAFGSDTVCAVLNTVVAFGSDTVCAALNTVVAFGSDVLDAPTAAGCSFTPAATFRISTFRSSFAAGRGWALLHWLP